jgi:hypothetical protein
VRGARATTTSVKVTQSGALGQQTAMIVDCLKGRLPGGMAGSVWRVTCGPDRWSPSVSQCAAATVYVFDPGVRGRWVST